MAFPVTKKTLKVIHQGDTRSKSQPASALLAKSLGGGPWGVPKNVGFISWKIQVHMDDLGGTHLFQESSIKFRDLPSNEQFEPENQ